MVSVTALAVLMEGKDPLVQNYRYFGEHKPTQRREQHPLSALPTTREQ